MNDYIVRTLSKSGGIRILACCLPNLTQQVCALQQTAPTVSIAMGRGLAGGALMGALLKPEQRVALKFEGNGPLQKLIIEADSNGAVRGSAGNPAADAEPLNGRWNVAGILGRAGFLTVSKDLGLGREPYRGMVQLRTSEIGDDLAYYLTDSEQVPSAVGLGAVLNEQGHIGQAGGFLVQALPMALDSEIDAVMANIATLPPICELLETGGAEKLLEHLWGGLGYVVLEKHDLFFSCGCFREKVERALMSLGDAALNEMLSKDGKAEAKCEFCGQLYEFDRSDLEKLRASVQADGQDQDANHQA